MSLDSHPRYHMYIRNSALAIALAATGLFGSAATAQERVAVEGSRAVIAPTESAVGTDVLRNYDPSAEQAIYTTAFGGTTGYVYGVNGYGDLGKTQCFDAPAGPIEIQSVTFHMVKMATAAGMLYDVVLREGMPGLDDDPGAGPGAEIYRQEYDTGELTATEPPAQAVEHVFDTPQTVSTSFCIGVEWEAGWPVGELGLASTVDDGVSDPLPNDWEMWDTGAWFNLNEAWGLSVVMWVDVNYVSKGSSTDADPAAAASVRLAPNPASETAAVEFTMTSAQVVSVEVLNVLGQRVASVAPTALAAGAQRLPLPVAGLAAGTYVVRVTGEEFTATRRVTVAR